MMEGDRERERGKERERGRSICKNDIPGRRPLFLIKERQRVKLASKSRVISNGAPEGGGKRDGERERDIGRVAGGTLGAIHA